MCKFYTRWACGKTTVGDRKDWSCDVENHEIDLSMTGRPCHRFTCKKCVVLKLWIISEGVGRMIRHPREYGRHREMFATGGTTPV